jgi:hypothetical protein
VRVAIFRVAPGQKRCRRFKYHLFVFKREKGRHFKGNITSEEGKKWHCSYVDSVLFFTGGTTFTKSHERRDCNAQPMQMMESV